jgi:response regulator of citrate/malate metabolism
MSDSLQEMQTAEQAQHVRNDRNKHGMAWAWASSPHPTTTATTSQADRQDLSSKISTRQAIAYCLDRQTISTDMSFTS